jgi:hypothetical protein
MPTALKRSTLNCGQQKIQQRSLRPIARVAGFKRQKGAVAAVPGLDQRDAGVGDQFGPRAGSHPDEGIIESVQDFARRTPPPVRLVEDTNWKSSTFIRIRLWPRMNRS